VRVNTRDMNSNVFGRWLPKHTWINSRETVIIAAYFVRYYGFCQDEETEALLTADFEIGHFLRESIIPRAVLYFTGEALEDDDDDDDVSTTVLLDRGATTVSKLGGSNLSLPFPSGLSSPPGGIAPGIFFDFLVPVGEF